MGRLPTEFAGRKISFRVPYTMPGELIIPANTQGVQFPEGVFLHNSDKPFEIHRVIPRVSALTSVDLNTATAPPPNVVVDPPVVYQVGNSVDQENASAMLERLTRIRIFDFSKNENLTKNAQLLTTLTKGSEEKTWEWAEPYTLVRSEGFQVTIDNMATPLIVEGQLVATVSPAPPAFHVYTHTRLELAFQGYLIVVAPPGQYR